MGLRSANSYGKPPIASRPVAADRGPMPSTFVPYDRKSPLRLASRDLQDEIDPRCRGAGRPESPCRRLSGRSVSTPRPRWPPIGQSGWFQHRADERSLRGEAALPSMSASHLRRASWPAHTCARFGMICAATQGILTTSHPAAEPQDRDSHADSKRQGQQNGERAGVSHGRPRKRA